jgi:WD40 repeat protein
MKVLERPIIVAACLGLLWWNALAEEPSSQEARPFPSAVRTFPKRPPYNALHLGPGNTFSVSKIPPDYDLTATEFSPDGRWIALGWASGRIEISDIGSGDTIAEFKSDLGEPYDMQFDLPGKRIVASGPEGRVSIYSLPSGKRTRRLKFPLGRYKYDIQDLVLGPAGKWLAYANGENGKVVDLASEPPSPIADLGEASALSLSQDGRRLWGAGRKTLFWLDTSTWQGSGPVPLKSPPSDTAPPAIQSAEASGGGYIAVVESKSGLVLYGAQDMTGSIIASGGVDGFSRSGGFLIVRSKAMVFMTPAGEALCLWAPEKHWPMMLSDDDQWLGSREPGQIRLWRMKDLMADCFPKP